MQEGQITLIVLSFTFISLSHTSHTPTVLLFCNTAARSTMPEHTSGVFRGLSFFVHQHHRPTHHFAADCDMITVSTLLSIP